MGIGECLQRRFVNESYISLPFSHYGSGYPNATTDGVNGRDLLYFFHPLSYGQYPGYGSLDIYNQEYGPPDNKRRPGGPLYYVTIRPPASLMTGPFPEIPPMTLFVIADKPTLNYIKASIQQSYSTSDDNWWFSVERVKISKQKKFKGPAEDPNGPAPEQAVVYYRGNSVVLSLLGYNNTAQFSDCTLQNSTNLINSPLPSVTSTPFFQCINETLGEHIPLVVPTGAVPYQPNAAPLTATPQPMLLVLVFVIWRVLFR